MTFCWWFYNLTNLFPAKDYLKKSEDYTLSNLMVDTFLKHYNKYTNKKAFTVYDPIFVIDHGE